MLSYTRPTSRCPRMKVTTSAWEKAACSLKRAQRKQMHIRIRMLFTNRKSSHIFARVTKQAWNVMLHNRVLAKKKKLLPVRPHTLTHTHSSWITYMSPEDRSTGQHGQIRPFLLLKSPSWVWHSPVPTSLVPTLAILVILVYWCDWKLQTQAVAKSPVRPRSDWLSRRELFCLCHCPHGETQVPPLPLKSQETPLTAVGCFDVSRISSFSSLVFFSFPLSRSLSVKLRV